MRTRISLMVGAALLTLTTAAAAQTHLRIGLAEDPDLLDPHQARTFVGRLVFTALCDKLVDIDADLKIVPRLATEWKFAEDGKAITMKLRQGVKFHDGEKFDAAAAKYNLERALTLPESRRKSEVAAIASVDVVDDYTIRMNLKTPSSPLLAQLTDRAGMMVSPKAAKEMGAGLAKNPVCSGPFKFVERVQNDRIVLERFADYWNKGQVHFDKVTFLPIPDATVRLANLQSGQLDLLERLLPTDIAAVKADKRLMLNPVVGLGYASFSINVGQTERAKTPLGQDKRVREAVELAIDRNIINQVVFNGEFTVGNQPVAPNNPFYAKTRPVPKRDVAKAKELLKAAGVSNLAFEMNVPNDTQQQQVAQVIQGMLAEAGITMKIVSMEFATVLQNQTKRNYQASLVGWSGRPDPDGNMHIFLKHGAPLNETDYNNPEVGKLLDAARETYDVAKRQALYTKAAELYLDDRPIVYLYHQKWLFVHSAKLAGFKPLPDAMIRLEGVKLQ
ncbi:MAG: ABC transporter substrate-binding protein [Alphaproteobacteria bacterium]|nr:ABC transporter substrate-binding protein [Alphaproteobacteria bacterium]